MKLTLKLIFLIFFNLVSDLSLALGAGTESLGGGGSGKSANTGSGPAVELQGLPSHDKRKCLPQLKNWIEDDKSNSLFFIFEETPYQTCHSGFDPQKKLKFTKTATDTHQTLKERFPESLLGSSVVQNIGRCADDSDPQGKDVVTKYYMANVRLRDGMQKALEGMASIDATLPASLGGTSKLLPDFVRHSQGGSSCSRFNLDKVCARLQSCASSPEDEKEKQFDLMAAATAKASLRLQKLEELQKTCEKPWSMGPNISKTPIENLNPENAFQAKVLQAILDSAAFKDNSVRGTDIFPVMQLRAAKYLKDPRSYPAKDREILKQLLNEACNPIVLENNKADLIRSYPVIGQKIFRDQFRNAVPVNSDLLSHTKKAMAVQLKENRKSLDRLYSQFDLGAQCVYGTWNGKLPCSARKLNEALAKTLPIPDTTGPAGTGFNEGADLLQRQKCTADLAEAQNRANDVLASAAADIALLAGSGGVALVARGGAMAARLGLSGAEAVARAGQVNMLIDGAWARRAGLDIANTCLKKPQDVSLLPAANENQCPMIGTASVKDTLEYNSCMESILMGSMDIVPFGVAGALAITTKKAANASRAAAAASEVSKVEGQAIASPAKSRSLNEIPEVKAAAKVKHERIRLPDGSLFNLNNGVATRGIAKSEGRLIENAAVQDVKSGKAYNFVYTSDGKLTLGEVNNNAEIGVKHLLLADGRPVKAAGEVRRRADGTLEFNLQSGTFTVEQKSRLHVSEDEIAKAVQDAMGNGGKEKVKYSKEESLTPKAFGISDEQILNYCRSSAFRAVNNSACGKITSETAVADGLQPTPVVQASPGAVQQVPDLTGKTREEAVKVLEEVGFAHKSTTAGGYRQYKNSDGSAVWFGPDGEITRSGPPVARGNGKTYNPRFDQNGKKAGSDGYKAGEFLHQEPIQSRSALSQAELTANSKLPLEQKITGLEKLLKKPAGSLQAQENFASELARIEKEYPTQVSTVPVAKRSKEEQKMLIDKRAELRKIGLTDPEIQRGMDAGYFGVSAHGAVKDPQLMVAVGARSLSEDQRFVSFVDPALDYKRRAAVIESVNPNGEVTVFDGAASRVLSKSEIESAAVDPTSANYFKKFTNISEIFPPGSQKITHPKEGVIQTKIAMNPPFEKVTVLQTYETREFARRRGMIKENVPITTLEEGKSYTYVILDDGSVVYGQVQNSFEYGVKHLQLANGRPVVAAGEIKVGANRNIEFNLESGSFTRELVQKQGVSKEALRAQVAEALARKSSATMRYTDDILLPKNPPNRQQMREICGEGAMSRSSPCQSLDQVPESYPTRYDYPAGAAANPAAMQASDVQAARNILDIVPSQRVSRTPVSIPSTQELAVNAAQQGENRIFGLERELGRKLSVKDPSGKVMSRSELARAIDKIEIRYPTTVSQKPFDERSAAERANLIGKMKELKNLGLSEDEIRMCLRNGFCGDPPIPNARILDSVSVPPLTQPTPSEVQATLKKAQVEISNFNYKSTEEPQLSVQKLTFEGANGVAETNNQGFAGARNHGVEIVEGPDRPMFAKIAQVGPATDSSKMLSFKNEVFFTKYMSDIGKGPEFHGIFVRQTKPGQPAKSGDGSYRIATDAVPGENFQLSASTAESARKFSYSDIDHFESEAKSLVTDYGVNPGDYQARIARESDGKPKVFVVDVASYSFHKGNPQRALNYLQLGFQEFKAQKIVTELADKMGSRLPAGRVGELRRQLEKMPPADFEKAYQAFKNANPTQRERLANLPVDQWL